MSRRSSRVTRPPLRAIVLWSSIGLVTAIVLLAIALTNRAVPPSATDVPPVSPLGRGDSAPNFSTATNHGAFALASQHRPVVLEVFATWCPHCQRETAVLNRLYDRYNGRVAFVAVSGSAYGADRTSPESETDVLAFVRYFNVRYPVAFDDSLRVAKSYLKGGYPTIVIIGSDKKIAFIGSGELTEAALEKEIRNVS
jgi:thiol-disulfide isomerase/thioredoxin